MSLMSNKAKSIRVNIEQLKAIEPPDRTTSWAPVKHSELVNTFQVELESRGFEVVSTELAVSPNGNKLFGAFDLSETIRPGILSAFGFRHSNDKRMKIKAVAGARVTVCDNMMLSGDMTVIGHKHTIGYNLRSTIQYGLDKWQRSRVNFANSIERMQNTPINDSVAQAMLAKALYEGVITHSLFKSAYEHYFEKAASQPEVYPDCVDRSLWGLHNSLTRALKEANPMSAFETNVELGKIFKL